MTQPSFLVVAPTRAFLGYGTEEQTVSLAPGTLLRYLRAGGFGDPCSDIYLDWDEFEVVDGDWAGQVVVIEDAATPRDERAEGFGPHLGYRQRRGPPASVQPETQLPAGWIWAVVV